MSDTRSDNTSDVFSFSTSEFGTNDTQYRITVEVPRRSFPVGESIFLSQDPAQEYGISTSNGGRILELPSNLMNLRNGEFEVTRPIIYKEGSIYTIPLFLEVNLIPGEVWPMAPQFRDVQFVLEWALKQLPFGACYKINENGRSFGTIAVISYNPENNQITLIGHQRFEVLEIINQGIMTCTEARVKIIKDTTLFNPLNKLCLDPKKHHLGHGIICSKRNMFQTQWPSWVYKQFDVHELASRISKKVKMLCKNIELSDNPIFLSFQVTKLGVFSDAQVNKLLSFESTNLRLQCELSYLNNINVMDQYICAGIDCGAPVCKSKNMFSISATKTHERHCKYWNTSRTMITVSNLDDNVDIITLLNKTTECYCFSGYEGTSIICKACNNHLGWNFVVDGDMSLTPMSFYGLSITALKKTIVKLEP